MRAALALAKSLTTWEDYDDGERPLADAISVSASVGARLMAVTSAGIFVYRRCGPRTEFLLGHPGGPLWARKDVGAWMVPKGLIDSGEEAIEAARREFAEETGIQPPAITHLLTPLRQAGGKTVLCWAAEGDLDLAGFEPGAFEMEWPPRSGWRAMFPELDRLAYFNSAEVLTRILPFQAPLIATLNINNVNKRLATLLASRGQAGRGLPAGIEEGGPRVSTARHRGRKLRCGLARPADLERGRDFGAGRHAGRHTAIAATAERLSWQCSRRMR